MTGPDVSISAELWVPEHYKSAAALAVTPSGNLDPRRVMRL